MGTELRFKPKPISVYIILTNWYPPSSPRGIVFGSSLPEVVMTFSSVIRGTNCGKLRFRLWVGSVGIRQFSFAKALLLRLLILFSHPGPFSFQHQCDVGCCGW